MPLHYDPAVIARFLVVLDLAGTFVFALSGAMAGIKHRLDLFGVLVLSFAAGNAGGLTRDLLLGFTPHQGSRTGATSWSRSQRDSSPSSARRSFGGCAVRCWCSTQPASRSSPSPAR